MKLIKKFEITRDTNHKVLFFDKPITFTQDQTMKIKTETKKNDASKIVISICR